MVSRVNRMSIASQLRARNAAGIAGSLVCLKTGISRNRLSIERGYVTPRAEELARIDAAMDELIGTKQKMAAVGAADRLAVASVMEGSETVSGNTANDGWIPWEIGTCRWNGRLR